MSPSSRRRRVCALLLVSVIALLSLDAGDAYPRGECSWKKTSYKKLRVESDKEIRHVISDAECQRLCRDEEQFECRTALRCAFNICRLSRHTSQSAGVRFSFFTTMWELTCVPRWRPWSVWGLCSVPCGRGHQTRRRVCEGFRHQGCPGGKAEERRPCDAGRCKK